MGIELQLNQNQTLSQRMLESIQILQMNTEELTAYINDLSMENPVLEYKEPEKESLEQIQFQQTSMDDTTYSSPNVQNLHEKHKQTEHLSCFLKEEDNLYSYLFSQINTNSRPSFHTAIIKYMIDSLDERGYFVLPLEEVAQYFLVPVSFIESLLYEIQSLEPSGIGARSLKECLQIQLKHKGIENPELFALIESHLDLAAKKKYQMIAQKLQISPKTAVSMCNQIKELDPKPGSLFSTDKSTNYIIPDAIVINHLDRFEIQLNHSRQPEVFVNNYYKKMFEETEDVQLQKYLYQKIQQTEWIAQCLQQRNTTLTAVLQEIVKYQRDFFENTSGNLHPLTLQDIAKHLNLHESTISRAIEQKYIQCSRGCFPLSFFFHRKASALKNSRKKSDTVPLTDLDIKRVLHQIIENENKKKPYSDRLLCEELIKSGIHISRRTVAKYREAEQIPDASSRKAMYSKD